MPLIISSVMYNLGKGLERIVGLGAKAVLGNNAMAGRVNTSLPLSLSGGQIFFVVMHTTIALTLLLNL